MGYFTTGWVSCRRISGWEASHGLDAVNIGAQSVKKKNEARKQRGEKLPFFKPPEGSQSQLTKIAYKKKFFFFEKQIHQQTVSPAPFISTSVVLIERLTAGSREINVFSLTRE